MQEFKPCIAIHAKLSALAQSYLLRIRQPCEEARIGDLEAHGGHLDPHPQEVSEQALHVAADDGPA